MLVRKISSEDIFNSCSSSNSQFSGKEILHPLMRNNSLVPSMTFKNLVPQDQNSHLLWRGLIWYAWVYSCNEIAFHELHWYSSPPLKQMLPLPSVQPLTEGKIKYTFKQSQLSIAGSNHQQLCHKAQ